jgi:hypothetical protein
MPVPLDLTGLKTQTTSPEDDLLAKARRNSENYVPFVAAVQTTSDSQPQFVCLRQQPFAHEEVAVFAARSIVPSATVVSDGLWSIVGA